MAEIKNRFGENGIIDHVLENKDKAEITDDTQMTLFTAEGLLRAESRGRERGVSHPPDMVYFSYLRWLHTQGYPKNHKYKYIYDGFLLSIPELFEKRGPGNTCLSALESGKKGSIEEPINNSKGCGGVMRSAPIGLFYDKEKAFQIASECAALTHGHPSGYLSAGVLAYIISDMIEGSEIKEAVLEVLQVLQNYNGHEECTSKINKAIELVESNQTPEAAIKTLGEGWVGEEAIAIAIYCAIKYSKDFKKAVIAAVNHDGDSDSTGAITGNIVGAYLGFKELPSEWLEKLELSDIITQIADDIFTRYVNAKDWWKKYPGW